MGCGKCGESRYYNYRPKKKRKTKGFFSETGTIEKKENKGPPTTPCECKFQEGQELYCDRHKCVKTKQLHELCQYSQGYFDLWEQGEGPLQAVFHKEEEKPAEEEVSLSDFFMGDLDIPAKSRGLGDTVAKITKITGIKKLVYIINDMLGRECACTERQSFLNRLFPYEKPKKTKGFF
tara:strand:+ start:704 stop:1237 length:534 start_codon:yes stop_codon:yes gene_type:complete